MNVFLVVVSVTVLASMLSIILFKIVLSKKISRNFWLATLIMYFVSITTISLLGNLSLSLYMRINLWGLFVTISAFIATFISLIKNNNKACYISFGVLTIYYFISCLNSVLNIGWDEVFNYYCMMYEMNIYIFIIVSIVKKNNLAVRFGKLLIVFYIIHILIRAIVYATDIGTAIIEIIFFGIIALILGLPLYLLVKKRIKQGDACKYNQVNDNKDNEADIQKDENEEKDIINNELDDIID